MRTTVTLTPEAEAVIKREMAERNLSFKDALNEAILRGVAERPAYEFRTKTHRMGQSRLNLDKASQIAAELENEEILRKMSMGK